MHFPARQSKEAPFELFADTSGRWLVNEALRRAERLRYFNVTELKRLAAAAVGQNAEDVVRFEKYGEGGYNRVFLITMRNDFQLIARIPYPATEPKYLAVASEAATLDYLRLNGIPVPKVYGYSATSDNAAGTEYIFMELMCGTNLGDIWFDMPGESRIKFLAKIVKLEARLFGLKFPASGSLYYSADLEGKCGKANMPGLNHESSSRFCIGPEVTNSLWHGKRLNLEVDRGPYTDPIGALVAGARKEIAYLTQYGRSLLPSNPVRREIYDYKELSPTEHLTSLEQYLRIAPHLLPHGKDTLLRPIIRHSDLNPNNVFVSKDLEITGLIDWQHCAILPLFVHCGIPKSFQHYGDSVSESLEIPDLPPNYDALSEREQGKEVEMLLKRQLHFFYIAFTEKLNPTHYDALIHDCSIIRRKVYVHANNPWEGDDVTLKHDLIEVVEKWSEIVKSSTSTDEDISVPCPLSFTAEEISECRRLNTLQIEADEALDGLREAIGGIGSEGWIPAEYYEEAKQREQHLLADSIERSESEYEREKLIEHWPFKDFDEEPYT